MRHFYLLLLMLGLMTNARAQEMMPKLSPVTKTYLHALKQLKNNRLYPEGYVYKKRNDGKLCVSAIIRINAGDAATVADRLKAISATIGTKAGIIWTVQVPVEQVKAFTETRGISYIQLDEPVVPDLDVARVTTRVDSAHAGYSLPMGYSGKGVIVGIMDFGFDYNHPVMYDTSGARYRILRAWEMNGTGTAPAGYTYGNEISDTNALRTKGTDNPDQTHGTGVAGLASGSGYGSAGAYKGVAYESDMIMVGVRRDSIGGQWFTGGFSDFIDGVNYMLDYAQSVSKPIVVNISWGSHSGPHDGSSLVNQAFDFMSGKGKIIVMSAGNEGNNLIHLGKDFTATDTSVSTYLAFSSTPYKRTWVDVWGDTGKNFCVNTTLYSHKTAGNNTGRICADDANYYDTLISANGLDTCFVQTLTSSAEYNMKPRITINIYSKTTDSIRVDVTGTSGKINMWDEYYYYGYTYKYASAFSSFGDATAVNGNTATTISDMGAGKSTLLIGAYTSKTKYKDINGNSLSVTGTDNQIAPFSSRGPYIDGRIRPDITAPGLTIATSASSWNSQYSETGSSSSSTRLKFADPKTGKNYYFAEFSGTSASSPMAAGIIALLLQVDPTLTPDRVRDLLTKTAIKDFYTGALPPEGNNTWGKGKINAYGAIRQLLNDLSVTSYKGNKSLDCVLFPNPNNGNFTLDLQSAHTEKLRVAICDVSGKEIKSLDWKVNTGHNDLPLDLNSVGKGIYFITVQGADADISIKALVQ